MVFAVPVNRRARRPQALSGEQARWALERDCIREKVWRLLPRRFGFTSDEPRSGVTGRMMRQGSRRSCLRNESTPGKGKAADLRDPRDGAVQVMP